MSHNTLLHHVVRPGVRLLAGTGVTPNQVTTLRLLTGLSAAVGLAHGEGPWAASGAALLVVSMLLDRADGELARHTGQFSRMGYRYDLVADGLSTIAVFVGMGLGGQTAFGTASWVCGLVAAAGVLALFVLMRAFEPGEDSAPTVRLVDPDDALLLVPVLVWSGLMGWTVVVTAVVTPSLAVILALLLLHRRFGSRSPTSSVRQGTFVEGG